MAYNPGDFGKPKHGGGRYKTFKLQQGNNNYRIGPAFKSLAAAGKWYFYQRQHFGYRTPGNEENPKGFLKTFLCNLEINRKTEMVEVPCLECEKIDQMKALLEKKENELKLAVASGEKTEAQKETILGPIKGWLKDHNLDKKYLVIAMNEKGEWGVLPLPYKAKSDLDREVKKVQAEEGFDPLDPEGGCWVNFIRTGEGYKTEYKCEVVKEAEIVNGRKMFSTKMYSLTDKDYEAISAELPDLSTVGRKLTVEQVEALVESNGDPDEVERVFSQGEKREKSPVAAPKVEVRAEQTAAPSYSAPKAVPEAVQQLVDDPVPSAEDDEEAAAMRALEEARAKKAAKALVTAAGNKTPATKTELEVPSEIPRNVKELPDAEFLALFPKKKVAQ